MSNGLMADRSDGVYTMAMLILIGCLLVSSVIWFSIDGMRGTAIRAIAEVATQKTITTPTNTSVSNPILTGKTLTFTLGGQTFTREANGDVNSPVVIAEFSDFQCPYCMQAVPTIQQLEKKYAGKVQIVHMNFVVHSGARLAALAAECAGEQGQYWAMHDAIFSQQKYDKAGLSQIAVGLGMDKTKFEACLDSGKYETAVDAEQSAGDSIGVQGTPTFLIGKIKNGQLSGKTVVGALPLSSFETEVQTALNN